MGVPLVSPQRMKHTCLLLATIVLCLFARQVWGIEVGPSRDSNNGPTYFAVFEGNCRSLIIESLPSKAACAPILMVSKFQSGGTVFLLQQVKGDVIAFKGAMPQDSDDPYQVQVYSVSINEEERRAEGRCDFKVTSQSSGSLRCEATMDGERYSTDFVIDKAKKVLEK